VRSDKALFVTGASSGIGNATAEAAAARGWAVALAARSEDRLAACAARIGPDRALALPCDITQPSALAAAVAAAAEAFGAIHAVFANAGLPTRSGGCEEADEAAWRATLETNMWGTALTCHAVLPYLKATRGHLVLTGSKSARSEKPGFYGPTKRFVEGLAAGLNGEMEAWGGRCTLITPGVVETPFFDTPRPGALRADDVAAAVLFALERPRRVNVREIFLTPTAL